MPREVNNPARPIEKRRLTTLGRKASDEFAVPLCRIYYSQAAKRD